MSHSDYQPSNREPSADGGELVAHDSSLPFHCAVPADHEMTVRLNDQHFEDDEKSSNDLNEQFLSIFRPPPALLPDVNAPPVANDYARPLSRSLFEELPHPLWAADVFPQCFLIPSLQGIVIWYLPMGDYLSPLKIRPFSEYSHGGITALQLTDTSFAFDQHRPELCSLSSLHDYVFFMPPPVAVEEGYGIEFDSTIMIRALPSAFFEHLNVLHIQLHTFVAIFSAAISRLEDMLANIKLLIVQFKRKLGSCAAFEEFFVFDLRNAKDCFSGLLKALATMIAYDITRDLDQLLAAYALGHEQEVVLMDAVIYVDDERYFTVMHLLDHPNCRWAFQLGADNAEISTSEWANAHCIISQFEDSYGSIQKCDQLRYLLSTSRCFPFSGVAHHQLSHLYWFTTDEQDVFEGFAGFPNLQRLHISALAFRSAPVLQLEDTKRLKHLRLEKLNGLQIDVGSDRVNLDVLHLEEFRGSFIREENLFVHELEANGYIQPELLQSLCLRTEHVKFMFGPDNPSCKDWANVFVLAKRLHCEPGRIVSNASAESCFVFLKATHTFLRLESLQLDSCEVELVLSLFPRLHKLALNSCHVLLSFNVSEDSKDEHRLHFESLQECSLERCRLDVDRPALGSRSKLEDDGYDSVQQTLCYLSAPSLNVLSLHFNVGSVRLLLNNKSCPNLGAFRWSAAHYSELPFHTLSSDNEPLFPKLQELSLCMANREEESGPLSPSLVQRLSIPTVTWLSLTGLSCILNLDVLTLSCRWAHFSDKMANEYCQRFSTTGDFRNDQFPTEVGKWMMTRMPQVELLVIEDQYIYAETEMDPRMRTILFGNED